MEIPRLPMFVLNIQTEAGQQAEHGWWVPKRVHITAPRKRCRTHFLKPDFCMPIFSSGRCHWHLSPSLRSNFSSLTIASEATGYPQTSVCTWPHSTTSQDCFPFLQHHCSVLISAGVMPQFLHSSLQWDENSVWRRPNLLP